MQAFAYPMSDNEVMYWANPLVQKNINNWDILTCDRTLMVYPEEREGYQSTVVETVLVDGNNKTYTLITQGHDEWIMHVESVQCNQYGEVINLREWEYISQGGHNPKWNLWSYHVNGDEQSIIYNV